MSDTPEPDKPSALPAAARPRRPALRSRLPAPPKGERPEFPTLPIWIALVGIIMVAVHLFFGRDDFDMVDRALAMVPLFPLLWEIHRYSRVPRGSHLPFGVYALLYNYVTFSWPALFNTSFKDLGGPVSFTESARFEGSAAVAVSSLAIYAGILLGERVGKAAQPRLLRLYPPAVVPPSFSKAVSVYALISIVATELANRGFFPTSISVLVSLAFSLMFVIGVILPNPASFRGPWNRYLIWVSVLSGAVGGLLSGGVELIFRVVITVTATRWAYLRRFSVAALVVLVAVYSVVQPAKNKFREQVWFTHGAQQAPTYLERASAWVSAIDDLWSSRDAAQTSGDAAVSRFLELDPILHAFSMVPGRVRPGGGEAWVNVLYSPIPRFLWPTKPNTDDLTRNYGVAFNLQSEVGARSTSILLSLIVDGYWNFGWFGIVLVSVLSGLWVGICQTMYAGDHWAIRASGVAQFSQTRIIGAFTLLYAGVVQTVVGVLLASWVIYWLGQLLASSDGIRTRPRVRQLTGLRRRVPES